MTDNRFKKYKLSDKGREANKRYYLSDKGKKCKRIYIWKARGVICDFETIHEIYFNTSNCDLCNIELQTGINKTLDHCHSCGTVRGILCSNCNKADKLKCYLCDSP